MNTVIVVQKRTVVNCRKTLLMNNSFTYCCDGQRTDRCSSVAAASATKYDSCTLDMDCNNNILLSVCVSMFLPLCLCHN